MKNGLKNTLTCVRRYLRARKQRRLEWQRWRRKWSFFSENDWRGFHLAAPRVCAMCHLIDCEQVGTLTWRERLVLRYWQRQYKEHHAAISDAIDRAEADIETLRKTKE